MYNKQFRQVFRAILTLNRRIDDLYGGTPDNPNRPLSDPLLGLSSLAGLLHKQGSQLLFGRITDNTMTAHVYRVQCNQLRQPMLATSLMQSATGIAGMKDVHTYPVGTDVLCLWDATYPWAIILGALPMPGLNPKLSHPGILSTASRQLVDEAHHAPLRMHANGDIPYLVSGRLQDSSGVGEYGAIAETGMRVFSDQFMAQVGLDEFCGLSVFYFDHLVRLAARNYQHWSATREHEALDSRGELLDFTGFASYPWETLGLFSPGKSGRVLTPAEWQTEKPWLSKVEPEDQKASPFHREREFHGYHGQGGKTVVQLPPAESSATNKLDQQPPLPIGVFDATRTRDGQLLTQAARGVSFIVSPAIVVPTRRQRPEDPPDENYSPSGYRGVPLNVKSEPAVQSENAVESRLAGLMDRISYRRNFLSIYPFVTNRKEWKVPEVSELPAIDGKEWDIPKFRDFGKSNPPAPSPVPVNVDHVQQSADLYQQVSGIEHGPDGSLVMFSGCGCRISLANGQIELSSPGSIMLKAGKDVVQWAGYDVILRAKNAVDVSATEGAVSVKANTDVSVLAGNSGAGGVLVESKGSSGDYKPTAAGKPATPQGVVIKSDTVAVLGESIYMRTGIRDERSGGPIILDASRGNSPVMVYASDESHFLGNTAAFHFGTEQAIRKSTVFSESAAVISGETRISGGLGITKGLFTGGHVMVAKGHVLTENAARTPSLLPLEGSSLGQIYSLITDIDGQAGKTLPASGFKQLKAAITAALYATGKVGNAKVLDKLSFAFRSSKEYGTIGMTMFEDLWQQLARLSGQTMPQWKESPVTLAGHASYPWPGKEVFETNSWQQQDLTIFDPETGAPRDRAFGEQIVDCYKDPKLAKPVAKSLHEYTIVGATQ